MGNLKTENSNYPNVLDTATIVTDTVDDMVASHINGPVSAILAIENELGLGLKGTTASLAERISKIFADNGGLLSGTSFPVTPNPVPHFFYRTDAQQIYVYNTLLAQYDSITTSAALASYIRSNLATTITAVHTFNPDSAGPPFILGANAQNQKVVGLDAETVDGKNPASANGLATLDVSSLVVQNPTNATATPTASKIPIADGSGKLVAGWGGAASTLATLDASSKVVEDPVNATATPTASKIPIADGSGKLVAGWGGAASTLATLDANSRVVESANSVWDGTAGRSASPTPGANTIPVSGAGNTIAIAWIAPVTAKGDLIVHDGSALAQQSVGSNGKSIVADSSTSTGLQYQYGGTPIGFGRLTSVFQTSSTGYVDVTGLTFSVAANKDYYFDFELIMGSNTGGKLALNGPSGATVTAIETVPSNTSSGLTPIYFNAFDDADSFVLGNGSTLAPANIRGVIRVSATPGTLALRFLVASGTGNINTGSFGRIWLLN